MAAVICGSLAFDTIMTFEGRFADQILPDQLHILNVSFLVPGLRRDFGGCAGNIAYSLNALGGRALPMATVGSDGADYIERLRTLGISTEFVRQVGDTFTAQAMIMNDRDNNQITAFHPGAMNYSHENRISRSFGADLAIIGPDGKEGMLQHARQCAEADIAFVFDPGQGLPMFSSEELMQFVRQADFVAVNDYEGKLLEERTGRKLEQLAKEVKALVCTMGAKGSVIFADGKRHEIPIVEAEKVVDPTGCGDAYRAGLLYGIAHGWDWPSTGRLSALLGAIKIAQRGAQNHAPKRDEIEARFERAFGYKAPF